MSGQKFNELVQSETHVMTLVARLIVVLSQDATDCCLRRNLFLVEQLEELIANSARTPRGVLFA